MAKVSLNIAHRGFSAVAPENTMAAFRAAIEAGADGIELDVQLSKDGVPVVIHDEQVDRTTNGDGFVKDLALAQLRQLDAGSWFGADFLEERIPTLEDVFRECGSHPILFNVELKTSMIIYPGIIRTVVRLIRDYQMEERVIISSFNHRSVATVRRESTRIRTGLLYSSDLPHPWQYANKVGANALHPHSVHVTPAMVETAHLHGLLVNPWTVDDQQEMANLMAMGVDGIITNRPDRLRQLILGRS